jgi:hypothetical protein
LSLVQIQPGILFNPGYFIATKPLHCGFFVPEICVTKRR